MAPGAGSPAVRLRGTGGWLGGPQGLPWSWEQGGTELRATGNPMSTGRHIGMARQRNLHRQHAQMGPKQEERKARDSNLLAPAVGEKGFEVTARKGAISQPETHRWKKKGEQSPGEAFRGALTQLGDGDDEGDRLRGER